MLIDSTTSSLADDSGNILPAGTFVVSDLADDEDDGYSIVSRASSGNIQNLGGTTPGIDAFLPTDLLEKTIMIDESVVSVTSTSYEPQPNESATGKDNETIDDDDDDDDATEFSVVNHTLTVSTDESKARNVVGEDPSPTVVPPADSSKQKDDEGVVAVFVILIFAMIVGYVMPILTGTSQNNSLQNEINLYKEQLQAQHIQVLQLQDEIQNLEYDAFELQEQHKSEIEMWQQKMHDMQVTIESRSDQKELVQKLQEQVHQLWEEASAMEVTSNQEIRRYQRGYREVQKELKNCNEANSFQVQALDELSEMGEQCTIRKRKLKKEFNKVKSDLESVKNKLRKETKELKDSAKEVKRQKKVILKLQKQLADIETKKAETRNEKKKNRNKEKTKFHTSDQYSSTFTWDKGTSGSTAEKSILVDNCWMYLQAKMDFGECLYDMTDHVKDHFQTMGQTMSHAFQNAMKHLRNEMEQYHFQQQSSSESSSTHSRNAMMDSE